MSVVNAEFVWTKGRRCLHWLAALTMLFTFPLLFVGGLVTSFDVGMAVYDWPTTFEQNMFLFPWLKESFGVMLEHGHRLFGSVVGILTLTMCVALFFGESRSWVRKLGLLSLAAVLAQGILGGMRVLLNAAHGRELAAFHGVFAQAFFALTVALWVFTSRRWFTATTIRHEEAGRVRTLAAVLTGLIYTQMIFGALLRHLGLGFIPHLGLAGGLVLVALWLTLLIAIHPEFHKALLAPACGLVLVMICQVFLGFGAMILTGLTAPGMGANPTTSEALVATAHLATGSLLLAVSVVLAIRAFRSLEVAGSAPVLVSAPRTLEAWL